MQPLFRRTSPGWTPHPQLRFLRSSSRPELQETTERCYKSFYSVLRCRPWVTSSNGRDPACEGGSSRGPTHISYQCLDSLLFRSFSPQSGFYNDFFQMPKENCYLTSGPAFRVQGKPKPGLRRGH